jgi:chemotaxis protein methyltransferase CheR
MQHLQIDSEDEYVERLRGAAPHLVEAELRNLLNLVTVTETCFFRDPSQFRLLRDHIVPALAAERSAKGSRTRTIRIWSAGCSSGEEAYSIALTLEDMGAYKTYADWKIEIVGTDVNTRVLEKARRGVYSPRAVRNVEGRLLDLHFVRQGRNFLLSDDIKRRVKFEFGNLKQTPMPSTGPQDVIFCKNVAIYFRTSVARRLIKGLHDTLAPDGYLLLGHAESLWQLSEAFTLVEYERTFCYRKRAHASRPPTGAHLPIAFDSRQSSRQSRGAMRRNGSSPGRQSNVAEIDAWATFDACLVAFRAGEWGAAESSLVELVASCPTFVPAILLLGGLYAHRGRFDAARQQAEAVLQLTDLEAKAHLLLGMIAARQQRTDEAVQSLRRALYLDDSLALAHFWLGNLYRDRGDMTRACLEYENVVRDWERRTLELTEEFASDLTAQQLVSVCSGSLERLRAAQAVNSKQQTANGKR